MKIVCKVERPGGSLIDIGGIEYRFTPESEGGLHVADVTEPAHIRRFLEIPDYCAYDAAEEDRFLAEHGASDPGVLTEEERAILGLEEAVATGERVAPPAPEPEAALEEAVAAPEPEPVQDPPAEPEAALEEAVATGDDEPGEAERGAQALAEIDDLVELSDRDLSYAYRDVFGKAPHGNKHRDSIIDDIRKARRAEIEAENQE